MIEQEREVDLQVADRKPAQKVMIGAASGSACHDRRQLPEGDECGDECAEEHPGANDRDRRLGSRLPERERSVEQESQERQPQDQADEEVQICRQRRLRPLPKNGKKIRCISP